MNYCNYTRPVRVTASGAVISEPSLLTSIILTVETAGDYLKVYDGQDDGGRLVFTLEAAANRSTIYSNGKGVLFPRGIYAAFEKTDSEATFLLCPYRESEIGGA
jgi:hypothetical protein